MTVQRSCKIVEDVSPMVKKEHMDFYVSVKRVLSENPATIMGRVAHRIAEAIGYHSLDRASYGQTF